MVNIIKYIRSKIKASIDVAIVTGSGLADIYNILTDTVIIDYKNIPEYYQTTVKGHDGKFVFGKFNGKNILIAVGRFHYYEGFTIDEVGLPIKVMNSLGCKKLILTNSAGCLNTNWHLGDIMIVNGHYDFTFRYTSNNPKLENRNKFYDLDLINLSLSINENLKLGSYGWVLGPSYETKAEIQDMKSNGVDAVGMSTVPEVMMASSLKMETLVLSLMSNYAVGLTNDTLNHDIVLSNSIKYNENFKLLIISILNHI
jgi:purine-nucleoside phosphorylase